MAVKHIVQTDATVKEFGIPVAVTTAAEAAYSTTGRIWYNSTVGKYKLKIGLNTYRLGEDVWADMVPLDTSKNLGSAALPFSTVYATTLKAAKSLTVAATAETNFGTDVVFIHRAVSPNTVVTAGTGSLCIETTNKSLFQNTGADAWKKIGETFNQIYSLGADFGLDVVIIAINDDPSTGSGITAGLGSIASDVTNQKLYIKTNTTPQSWTVVGIQT